MLVALGDSCSAHISGAASTDQVLDSRVGRPHGIILTVVHASKVRLLALEALVEGALEHGILLKVVVEAIVGVLEAVMALKSLMLGSRHGEFLDSLPDLSDLLNGSI